MQDGIGQMGAGASDMRLAGEDMQHYRDKLKRKEKYETSKRARTARIPTSRPPKRP